MRRCCRSRTPDRRGANGRTCGLTLGRMLPKGPPKKRALTGSLRDLGGFARERTPTGPVARGRTADSAVLDVSADLGLASGRREPVLGTVIPSAGGRNMRIDACLLLRLRRFYKLLNLLSTRKALTCAHRGIRIHGQSEARPQNSMDVNHPLARRCYQERAKLRVHAPVQKKRQSAPLPRVAREAVVVQKQCAGPMGGPDWCCHRQNF